MADVALRAGVSVTTVSHVMKGTRRISPHTEKAVRDAIAGTGYIYDGVAGSLRSGGTQTIGVAMSAISNPYFATLVHAIERALSGHGYSLLLADTHDEPVAETRALADLLSRRVDAIVLAPSAQPETALHQARRRGVPVVLIDRFNDQDVDPYTDQIGCENVQSTAALVDHLASLGHRRIAMMAGLRGIATSNERIAGYREGLRRNRLRFDRSLVVFGQSGADPAREALSALLAIPERPTALLVASNQLTIAAMRGLRDAAIAVPRDMALVAFDDFEWADLFQPRLTTVAQPMQEMAEQAVDMLLSRLADPTQPARRVRLPTTFVHRESCGCDPALAQGPALVGLSAPASAPARRRSR